MFGGEFVWLLPGWFKTVWWNETNVSCTAEEIRSALVYSLGFKGNDVIEGDKSRMLVSKKVSVEVLSHIVSCHAASGPPPQMIPPDQLWLP